MTQSEMVNAIIQNSLLERVFREALACQPARCVWCQWRKKAGWPLPNFWNCIHCLEKETNEIMMKEVEAGRARMIIWGRRRPRKRKAIWRSQSMADRRLYTAAKNA